MCNHTRFKIIFVKYIKSVDNLYPALVECFGIILLGYIAGKFNFINSVEAKGKEILNTR